MNFEVVLASCYGVFLLVAARCLIIWGRRNYGPHNRAIRHLFPNEVDVRRLDVKAWGWPHGEAARLTIGIALVMTAVAIFELTVFLVRHWSAPALLVLGPVLCAALVAGWRLLALFRQNLLPER